MSANNPVFQVLVVSDDSVGAVTAGQTLTDLVTLGVGAIGVFSYDTGLAVDSTTVVNEREIFIAVAVDTDGDGVADDIRTSAGTHIQKKNVNAYTLRCYSPELPNIVDITGFADIKCESDYAFKVEFRGNTQLYMNNGFNQFAKTFAVRTACCGPGCDCPSGDCNELVKLLIKAINNDVDGLLTAVPIPSAGGVALVDNEGTGFDDEIDVWAAANPGDCLGIRITSVAPAISTYCNLPLKYYKMNQYKLVVSLLEGLDCNGVITEFQAPSFGEGQGKDIGWLEYESGGYKGKPGDYRAGELVGTSLGDFERLSTNAGIYNQVNLHYSNESVAGWGEHKNKLNTIIAVPCTTTSPNANIVLTEILGILDAFLDGQFDALVDDLAECTCSTSVVTYTTEIDDVALDGLG